MKKFLLSLLFTLAFSNQALASCYGSSDFYTCNQANGNQYTVSKMGGMTSVYGSNSYTGRTWNQTSNRIGDMTVTNGTSADGRSWNETTRRLGGGSFTQSGTDANGNYFERTCHSYDCN